MIAIIDCGTSWLDNIKSNLDRLGYSHRTIKLKNLLSSDLSKFTGVIISGSPTLLTKVNLNQYLKPFQFVKKVKVPLLGICLGHQVMGLLYSSKISMGKLIKKNEKIKIIRKNRLFLDIKNNSLYREEHSEQITLPKEFDLLAKSSSCSNEAMKHKKKKIYGVQFHPEVSGKAGRELLGNFLKLC